ncbi:ribosomal RNA processing protein 1 homolog [Anopheles aquasalis]|uniref:ribosomal RNA processing protein 1 homolog n=1 Tax=Anopheles aquasalis TaxID=42839 RepID=UPI00215A1903|nr:ribosomal RNA processing protein 1 homolog [Anopheles aquasalis]
MVIKEQNTPATVEETNSAMDDTFGCGETGETPAKTHIISQEIKFARALAGNDAKLRRKVLKNLETWLTTRSQSTFVFSDADFLRLWKGLFYCMWMSDKPLVQEELAESLGALVRCFQHDVPVALQFFKAFIVTMGIEWFGIDRWRTDKFMMLVRRVTRQMLFLLHETGWQTEHVALFVKTIETTILDSEVSPFGLTNHFNDLLLEEVAKVSDGDVPKGIVTQLVEPYVRFLMQCSDKSVGSATTTNIFHALFRQSQLGQAFEEKFELWKRTGFIHGHIDKKVYDPRAGRVSVTIPEIEFDCEEIISLFEKYRFKSFVTTIGKKNATLLVKQFKKFADGIYPLGIQRMPSINPRNYRVDIDEQVEDLEEFRRELYGDQKATNWKERKREIRLQKKLAREQQQQTAGGEDGTDGAGTEQEADDTAEPNTVVAKKKKSKKRKLNPTELKKQQKMELLKRKKEEKMKLLKERLKQSKKNTTNETIARKMEVNSGSSVDEKTPKLSSKKKLDMSSESLAKSPSKIQPPSTAGQAVKQANVGKKAGSKNGNKQPFQTVDEWSEPLKDGEEEYFIASRKLKKASKMNLSSVSSTSHTPVADERKKGSLKRTPPTGQQATDSTKDDHEPVTPARKRVKIALNKNVAQELDEHVKQVKSSPQMPFDSAKKPTKSLLKPNLIPSPVNPFYKKKIGLK